MATKMPKNNSGVVSSIDPAKYAVSEPLNLIEQYRVFCENEIEQAVKELGKIKIANNRVHLQKLVYTNLVNRFDSLVDNLVLWFSINNAAIRSEILKDLKDEPIDRKDVFELFIMREKVFGFLNDKIKSLATTNLLRDRHSKKVQKILSKALKWEEKEYSKSRVYENGKIYDTRTGNKKQPNSIIGYADWLYSRRNSIVHGDGIHYIEQDYTHIRKNFANGLPKNFRLQLPSITAATTFYINLLKLIEDTLSRSLDNMDDSK